ncbi:17183_t:CDS:2, partial [Funneliformis caledonium]
MSFSQVFLSNSLRYSSNSMPSSSLFQLPFSRTLRTLKSWKDLRQENELLKNKLKAVQKEAELQHGTATLFIVEKIPIVFDSFKEIVGQGSTIIDKTLLISEFIECNENLRKNSKFIMNALSYHDVSDNLVESNYHLFILGVFHQAHCRGYKLTSNREAGEGRFDLKIEQTEKANFKTGSQKPSRFPIGKKYHTTINNIQRSNRFL